MHPLIPLHAAIGTVGALALAWCLHGGLPRAALLVGAFCAYSWSALIVEALARLPAGLRIWRYRGWDGRYHEFGGRQIRVVMGADGTPWAVADDVLAAMALERAGLHIGGLSALDCRQPAGSPELLSLAGIRKLQRVARGDAAQRFARWFEAQVHDPAMRRAGRETAHSPSRAGPRRPPDAARNASARSAAERVTAQRAPRRTAPAEAPPPCRED